MNDRAVMEQLASDNMKKAYAIAYEYRNCGMDMEELKSAALFGLANAVIVYDPSKNDHFPGFAKVVIENAIRKDLRKLKRHFGQLHLDAEMSAAEDGKAVALMNFVSYEEPGFEQADNSDLIPSLLSGLPEKESQTIQLIVCDKLTQMKAAERMGISRSSVCRYLKSGLAKIRKKCMEGESEWERTKR